MTTLRLLALPVGKAASAGHLGGEDLHEGEGTRRGVADVSIFSLRLPRNTRDYLIEDL